jgi:Transcription factor WhiB
MSEPIIGACSGDKNPDAWFPTVPNGGKPSTILRRMVPEIKYALNICNTCSKKEECFEEGMKPVNLGNGIWGGVLAGDRIAIADERGIDYMAPRYNRGRSYLTEGDSYIEGTHKLTVLEKEAAISLSTRIKPYLEE